MLRRQRKTPWSRSGCDTCKRRHKKCDGVKPICRTCSRLHLECHQPDTFRTVFIEETERGDARTCTASSSSTPPATPEYKSHPRLQRQSKRSPSPLSPGSPGQAALQLKLPSTTTIHEAADSTTWIASSPSDSLCRTRQQLKDEFSSSQDIPDWLSLPMHIGYFPILSETDWQHLQYYVEKLSNLLLNAHGPKNPLRSLILPRMTSSPILIHSICSISAQHRAANAGHETDRFQEEATSYYVSALSNLKQWIPYILWLQETLECHNIEALEIALLSTIFLCKHEILKGGVANWRHHLAGVEFFCQVLEQRRSSCTTEIVTFARSFIAYHKSVASITDKAALNPTKEDNRAKSPPVEPSKDQFYVVDPYMGFSQGLVGVLQRVSTLRNLDTSDCGLEHLKAEVTSIVEFVGRRAWALQLIDLPEGMSTSAVDRLKDIARAYESAILAYLQSVIDDISEQKGQYGKESAFDELRSLISTSKGDAVTDCLKAISRIPVGSPEEPGLLPLLFIMACVAESPEQTWEVLQRVDLLSVNFGLGHMHSVGVMVHEIWSRRIELGNWHDWRGLLKKLDWDLVIC